MEIELGDKVRCKITGFTGIVVARTEFLNGCVQCDILPKGDKKNKMPEANGIDQQSLEVIKSKKKVEKKEDANGGLNRRGVELRGF